MFHYKDTTTITGPAGNLCRSSSLDDHRENPEKPVRTRYALRKLTDSTYVQLKADGTSKYPVRIVDNRPEYMKQDDPLPPHPNTAATGGNPDYEGGDQEEENGGDVR